MSAQLSAWRFAHTEGHACIRYTPDGNQILTCGFDGEVRVYRGIDDSDPESHLAGEEAFALTLTSDRFFVACSGTNKVQGYNLKDGTPTGVVTRFTADATALDMSLDGSKLVAGSDDTTLQLVDMESYQTKVFQGHSAPILNVALDPRSDQPEYILSSSCDGTVKVWNIQGENEVQTFQEVWLKSNDLATSKVPGTIAWHPNGDFIAVPQNDGVKIYARGSWELVIQFKAKEPLDKEEVMGSVAWSCKDPNFLASATTKGRVFIWDVEQKTQVFATQTNRDYSISDLAWHPKKYEVAMIDNQSCWGILNQMTFAKENQGERISKETKATDEGDLEEYLVKGQSDNGDELDPEQLAALMDDDDDDDDNENSFSISKIKRDTGFLSDDESNLSKPESTATDAKDKPNETSVAPLPPTKTPEPVAPAFYDVEIQEPFQPTATPVRLSSRFMVWNDVGVVKCFNTDDENSIEVDFHDTSVHHSFHISNAHNHTMADLSTEILVLACEASEDDLTPSRLVCRLFGSSDLTKEWSVELPGKEEILAVCCGQGWVGAATDRRQLRIFSSGGNQLEVLALPGPILALAGHGHLILVTCHVGMPLAGNQSVCFAVFDLSPRRRHPSSQFQPLPFAPNSYLTWVGFSDEGTPGMMDSSGQVRLLHHGFGSSWVQICDTRDTLKAKSDNHFLVGINEQEQKLRTILCKGARYPATTPYPTVALVPFSFPLCEPATEKSLLEEEYWKCDLVTRSLSAMESRLNQDLAEDKGEIEESQSRCLIKLFALALSNDHETRAMEVCKLMDTHTISLAIRYATSNRRMQLAQKIGALANDIQEEQERIEQERSQSQMSHADMFEMRSHQAGDENGDDDGEEHPHPRRNPILEAKLLKETPSGLTKTRSIIPDSQSDIRNPFAKQSRPGSLSGAIRKGDTVFDDMTVKSQSTKNRGSFGDRRIQQPSLKANKNPFGKQSTIVLKKTPNPGAKENDTASKSASPLSGFQLWLAENRSRLTELSESGIEDSAINIRGLEMWKELDKEEKEKYKSPRVPKRKMPDQPSSLSTPASKVPKI
ncbi:WD repeat and HMG-box DNA-binding protein 1-like [Tigriopus californicus]|uniref:WD repeat and HMG-box DNA-binding protein 1-like n=1 Tax=Tigriopus californicus TaxID=6832 RepID=UPI0027D9E442|nr:WD repeat and HMG-box DNA-binding protein 1-like [Tigriopus californicus]